VPLNGGTVTKASRAARSLAGSLEESLMNSLATPTQTPKALHWLHVCDADNDRIRRALLISIDGHRSVIELESFARALGLEPDALERLRREGFIDVTD